MRVYKPGARLKSAVCQTEVIVTRSPTGAADIRCGGVPMLATGEASNAEGSPPPVFDAGTLIGKRYADLDETLELLCVKGGRGSLSLGEIPLIEKRPKALPSSD